MASDMTSNTGSTGRSPSATPGLDLSRPASMAESERAVVGVYDDRLAAERAVDALEQAGFSSDRIGFALRGDDVARGGMIVDAEGTKDAKGAAAGAVTGGMVGGVLAAAASMLIPGVGPIMAGGILAAFFGGAIAGTAVGGILGAMSGLGLSEDEARFYERHFSEGRAIVAIRPGARVADAAEILARHGGRHIYSQATSPIDTHGTLSTP
jgi:hypothetical protein